MAAETTGPTVPRRQLGRHLERPGEIHRYQDVYAAIAAVALDEPASRALIRQAALVSYQESPSLRADLRST